MVDDFELKKTGSFVEPNRLPFAEMVILKNRQLILNSLE
jgi:hypothetical protein